MALVCLSLTGRSLAEDLTVLDLYRGQVDLVELRADYLDPSEKFLIRSFPERAGLPCILTVRRRSEGGQFQEGEGVRLVMLAKGLAYARSDRRANFAYVDLESDFHVPAVEEACATFGTRIIRSIHTKNAMPEDLDAAWAATSGVPEEVPKLAFACKGASDLARLVSWADSLPERQKIVVGMGEGGFPSRILAERMGSFMSYASAIGAGLPGAAPGQLDPEAMTGIYRFRSIRRDAAVYGLTGGPSVIASKSPSLHNSAFASLGIDAVYLPVPAEDAPSFFAAAAALGMKGAAVTVPLKESLFPYLDLISPEARDIGACNTLMKTEAGWVGHNTDAIGFERALLEFLEGRSLSGLRATIVGAGGAARAVAWVLAHRGLSCLVVNRSGSKARALARSYGFAWAVSDERATELVADHSDLIVNATSVGMDGGEPGDPLDWYEFSGREAVFDLIYRPERTLLLQRARAAGATVTNGWTMLRYQAAEQFRIWTGLEPPSLYYH